MYRRVFGDSLPATVNYLCVTLTPFNAILHTSRLYSMFRDYRKGLIYNENFLFYEGWDDQASQVLFACDDELQLPCRKLQTVDKVRDIRRGFFSYKASKSAIFSDFLMLL